MKIILKEISYLGFGYLLVKIGGYRYGSSWWRNHVVLKILEAVHGRRDGDGDWTRIPAALLERRSGWRCLLQILKLEMLSGSGAPSFFSGNGEWRCRCRKEWLPPNNRGSGLPLSARRKNDFKLTTSNILSFPEILGDQLQGTNRCQSATCTSDLSLSRVVITYSEIAKCESLCYIIFSVTRCICIFPRLFPTIN